jgi:hypothetical protein
MLGYTTPGTLKNLSASLSPKHCRIFDQIKVPDELGIIITAGVDRLSCAALALWTIIRLSLGKICGIC